jgi:uncharacterized membrane protein
MPYEMPASAILSVTDSIEKDISELMSFQFLRFSRKSLPITKAALLYRQNTWLSIKKRAFAAFILYLQHRWTEKQKIVRLSKEYQLMAMIASIYFILTMATLPVSFLGMQIRIAEMLILLCFFRKDFVIGVSVGTLLANTMSPMFAWDMLFGTLATLISGLLIGYMKQLLIAALIPVVINRFVVGLELHLIMGLPFWLNVGLVGLGEFIAVAILGILDIALPW